MKIKVNGKINSIEGTTTFEELKEKMKRPHLCSSCGIVACVGGRKLENAAINNAIKTKKGVYVLDCEDYIEDKLKKININREEETYFSSPSECCIMHPNVRHVFIR